MIVTEVTTAAAPATVHELLVDVDAWPLWSPHVAALDAPTRRVTPGWVGRPRAFFAPMAVPMVVDEVRNEGGYDWHSTLGPWTLRYGNHVDAAAAGGSTIRFTATLSGPAAPVIERIVAPLSARGQRRRMQRLADLAELTERHR